MNENLYSRSIDIILENQSVWGSYVASPAFPTYHYSWLRDGSFIAHSMDCVGKHESAASFFRWVGSTIQRYAPKVDEAERRVRAGLGVSPDHILHTRFTLDGHEGTIDPSWGNFQIDGYGTWLWALASHVRFTGDDGLLKELEGAMNTTVRYLALTWKLPNYDCWEEHPEYLHPSSLACAYGGLKEIAQLVREGKIPSLAIDVEALAGEIRKFILRFGVVDGKLIKHISPPCGDEAARPVAQSAVDSSLLGMAYPFKVLEPADPILSGTIDEIETQLHRKDGGVYRFGADVFYGGGEWILLTAWLGIHYLLLGQPERATQMLKWIESQADERGNLPEQICDHMLAPSHYHTWLDRWGPIASPLLWSHAMYLILYTRLLEAERA